MQATYKLTLVAVGCVIRMSLVRYPFDTLDVY